MPPAKRKILVQDAAKQMGMSNVLLQKWLRDAYLMKARPCPVGNAVYSEKGEWQYYINPIRLELYVSGSDLILTSERMSTSIERE